MKESKKTVVAPKVLVCQLFSCFSAGQGILGVRTTSSALSSYSNSVMVSRQKKILKGVLKERKLLVRLSCWCFVKQNKNNNRSEISFFVSES